MNIGKTIPLVGSIIGGGLELTETKIIGNRAYKWFFQHDFSLKEEKDGILYENIVKETESAEEANSE